MIGVSIIRPELLDILRYSAATSPQGAFAEVGVYNGGSAKVLYEVAQKQERDLYLYDTFVGIPFADVELGDDIHKVGDFNDCASPERIQEMMPKAIIQVGIFPRDTRPPDRSFGFVHLDCDQYNSYVEALTVFYPLMARGGRILCDDYCLLGAHRAIDEFCSRHDLFLVEHDHRATICLN